VCEHDQKGVTVWFTGLPGSGKSAIADRLHAILKDRGYRAERLDGDLVRRDLTRDLGFSRADREENIRRVAFVAKLLTRNDIFVLCSFVSPYREMRDRARREIGSFLEVFVKCPFEVCLERDVKGMYKKALAGEIKEFTGVSDPYEEPLRPDLVVETDKEPLDRSVDRVLARMKELGFLV
jgi:adenylyl-sulfate kinase